MLIILCQTWTMDVINIGEALQKQPNTYARNTNNTLQPYALGFCVEFVARRSQLAQEAFLWLTLAPPGHTYYSPSLDSRAAMAAAPL